MIAIWLATTGFGVLLVLVALQVGEFWLGGSPLVYLALVAMIPSFALLARSPTMRLAASGLLFGFAGFLRLVGWAGPIGCGSTSPLAVCVATAETEGFLVTVTALILALLFVLWAVRAIDGRAAPRSVSSRHRASGLAAGPELLREIERTLGVAVLVQSIDGSSPARIDALLIFGRYNQQVTATGQTEADAWRELAAISVAWRNADDKQVPLWWGAGGV